MGSSDSVRSVSTRANLTQETADGYPEPHPPLTDPCRDRLNVSTHQECGSDHSTKTYGGCTSTVATIIRPRGKNAT